MHMHVHYNMHSNKYVDFMYMHWCIQFALWYTCTCHDISYIYHSRMELMMSLQGDNSEAGMFS